MPTRWFAFEYFFVCIFAAFSIIQISYLFNEICLKKVFVMSLIFVMTFFMVSNSVSNLDSPVWLKENTKSTTYTHAEIQGAKTMSLYSEELFSDYFFNGLVLYDYLGSIVVTDLQKIREVFLWRNYMLDRPIMKYDSLENYDRVIQSNVVYGQSTLNKLEQINKIYDNGEIIAFVGERTDFKEIL